MKIAGNKFANKFIETIIDTSLNDEKGQNNRQTERKIINQSKEFVTPTLYSVDHTKSEYTFMQFLARYGGQDSGINPLKIRVNLNEDCLNHYKNSRELKGKHSNQFFNTSAMANLLNVPGYLKMEVISSNYPFGDWFTAKLTNGVYLYKKDPLEFYQKKLSNPLSIASEGDIQRQPFETITIVDSVSSGSGWDNVSHMGGGLYVYKDSHLWVIDKNTGQKTDDLFPWLMRELDRRRNFINSEDSSKWVLKHPINFTERIEIPSQYLTNNDRLVDGKPSCQIHYILNFFSSNEDSVKKGYEINATHFIISRESQGNKGIITIQIKGSHRITRKIGDPAGIPPTTSIPGASNEPEIFDPDPFDPDTPDPNTPEPTPGEPDPKEEPEPGGPDADPQDPDVPDPKDPDPGQDPDPRDPDPTDPEAPDIPDSGDTD